MPALDKYVLAIDMGSGSVKAALVSNRGAIAGLALREIQTRMLPGGGAEQEPGEWWSAVTAAARSAIGRAAAPAAQIVAIACTTQWAVTVAVDAQGNPLSAALSWMDTRGGPYNRALVEGWPKVNGYGLTKVIRWIRLTGGAPVVSGMDGLGHVLFIKHQRPEIYRQTRAFLEPMDYLNLRLTGRVAASHATIYPYWLTDNRELDKIDYAPALLRRTGIDRARMPGLLPVNAVLGALKPEAAGELGLSPGTPVVMGSPDSHAATIGAGAVRDYEGYFSVGTTSWLSCHVPVKKTDLRHMLATMPAALPGRYMVVAEQGPAGRCLELLKDVLYPADGAAAPATNAYEDLDRLAAAVPPGSDGLIFTPWISGVLAPSGDRHTRSAFFNQSARTTRGHYARAVMEGVALNLRWLKGYVEKFVGRRFEQLSFIGGGAQSELWCQIMADVLGCPVRRVAEARNASAVGAAMAAFAALGEISLDDIPALVKIAAVYHPVPAARQVYDRRFQEFLEFYKRMKPIYRRLNPFAAA